MGQQLPTCYTKTAQSARYSRSTAVLGRLPLYGFLLPMHPPRRGLLPHALEFPAGWRVRATVLAPWRAAPFRFSAPLGTCPRRG
uniref:Uncharacterized protein n=1 Tax=Siphoviridae sp. ct6bU4 TaxID=2825344 RepID=A0A8S5VAJ1_9CAUD|nr:MAG TPA: hypothetical protein [Siphoviridae sp. ct6bU4]